MASATGNGATLVISEDGNILSVFWTGRKMTQEELCVIHFSCSVMESNTTFLRAALLQAGPRVVQWAAI